MNSNATFAMTHFLKFCYNVFILENKIEALVFKKNCVKMCYITLEIALVCIKYREGFLLVLDKIGCMWETFRARSYPQPFFMTIQLITHNLQGLNNPLVVKRVGNYYQPLLHKVDLWCILEHKMRGQALEDLGPKLWRSAKAFHCKASLGNQECAGKGGLSLFVSSRFQHLISDYGTIGVNLAQWIVLQGLLREMVTVVNVYAPRLCSSLSGTC